MPPLRPGLLALLLLAPSWTAAQPALPPVAAPAAFAAADLRRHPELASDFDRGLLLDAGYSLEREGAVLDPDRKPLDEPSLAEALAELRAKRKEASLAGLESVQEQFAREGRLSPGQQERLRTLLADGWPLIPGDVRSGFNEMLAEAGSTPVAGPNLDWYFRVMKEWAKGEPDVGRFDGMRPSMEIAPPVSFHVPVSRTTFWRGRFDDEFSPPPASVVKARLAEVARATWRDPESGDLKPYAPEVKAALKEVMRYADARDGEAALAVLRELHPPIAIDNAEVPLFAGGVTYTPDPGSKEKMRIALVESGVGVVVDRKTGEMAPLPCGAPSCYKELGLPVPNVQALDPAAKPATSESLAYWTEETFADGSARRRLTPLGHAPVLLHELMHLDTFRVGGGRNSFANEMRSMTADHRLTYNRDEARGLANKRGYIGDTDWAERPLDFRRGILAAYSGKELGEIRPGEETVDGQVRAARALLSGGDLAAWKKDRIDYEVDAERDADIAAVEALVKAGQLGKLEADQARERFAAEAEKRRSLKQAEPVEVRPLIEAEASRLEKDRELTLSVFLEDWRWHQERVVGRYVPPREKP